MRTLWVWQFCAVLAVCSHRLRIGVASKRQLCPEGQLCLTCELGLWPLSTCLWVDRGQTPGRSALSFMRRESCWGP